MTKQVRACVATAAASVLTVYPGAVGAVDLCDERTNAGDGLLLAQTCKVLRAVNEFDAGALRKSMADDFALVTVSGIYLAASKDAMISRWTEPAPQGTHDGVQYALNSLELKDPPLAVDDVALPATDACGRIVRGGDCTRH